MTEPYWISPRAWDLPPERFPGTSVRRIAPEELENIASEDLASPVILSQQGGAWENRQQECLAGGCQKTARPPVMLGFLAKKADEKTKFSDCRREAAGHWSRSLFDALIRWMSVFGVHRRLPFAAQS
jgi:hypothetical protein